MDSQIDQSTGTEVNQADDDAHDHHESEYNQRVVQDFLLAGPGNLLQLMEHVLEEATDALEEIADTLDEAGLILLLYCVCHDFTSLS